MSVVTRDQLKTCFPFANPATLDVFDFGYLEAATIDTPIKLRFFLATLGHESDGLTVLVEDLNYSARRIAEVWPNRFHSSRDAGPYAFHPELLANRIYGGRMGNNIKDDGWRYRGRGFLQVTGRDNYRLVAGLLHLDLLINPDLFATPDLALRSACAIWSSHNWNQYAVSNNFAGLVRAVNGGLTGWDQRREWLRRIMRHV